MIRSGLRLGADVMKGGREGGRPGARSSVQATSMRCMIAGRLRCERCQDDPTLTSGLEVISWSREACPRPRLQPVITIKERSMYGGGRWVVGEGKFRNGAHV